MYTISEIQDLNTRRFFLDANILIYIFWPTGSHEYESKYSKVYGALIKQGNIPFVDFLVVSEVINRIVRTEYEKHLLNNGLSKHTLPYKKYRMSPAGNQVFEDIYIIIKESILVNCNIIGKSFSKEEILDMLSVDSLDVNDKAILDICKENDLVLITNDFDFNDTSIDILTANTAFFSM